MGYRYVDVSGGEAVGSVVPGVLVPPYSVTGHAASGPTTATQPTSASPPAAPPRAPGTLAEMRSLFSSADDASDASNEAVNLAGRSSEPDYVPTLKMPSPIPPDKE
jgi:hypothetical protein